MIANAVRNFNAVAFLPMEAEKELTAAGFKSIQPKELLSLRRNYSLIYSPRSASIRTEIERVSKEITKMIQ